MTNSQKDYDYIVVGGGSAGAVVAARLAGESDANVLLLEAGYSHRHPLLDMPAGIFKMIKGSKYMSYHKTTPQAHLDGRVHDIPQGNVLGGGSSVNAQVYMRGRPEDYDAWNQALAESDTQDAGWGWQDVLPHFIAMEGNNRLVNQLHGNKGPLLVSDPKHIDDSSRAFVQSAQVAGLPYNHDFNSQTQVGVGFYQFTNRDGRRSSSAYSYLSPQLNNPRLVIELKAKVNKVIMENAVAVGVEYQLKGGEIQKVYCRKEVIIAAGALISPQLLMLSGIGPKKQLREHNIDCVADLPGVGENLIDHPEVPIIATAKQKFGYFKQGTGWRMLKNALQFKLFSSGPVTSAGVEAGAFVNPENLNDTATIQAFCVPMVYLDRDILKVVKDSYGMTITTVVVKPKSRGYVKLASNNASDMPLVCPNLLKHPEDMAQMIAGQRFFIKVFQSAPLSDAIAKIELPNIADLTDESLARHCRQRVKTNYHPAGTCKMGNSQDSLAVLNSQLQVRKVKNLRVCDMSAVPDINAGNTNAVAMMLGNRCADFILAKMSKTHRE